MRFGSPAQFARRADGRNLAYQVLGQAKATARDGSSAEWKYTQVFHIRDGKTTEV
jgi:hypothetical protein